MKRRAFVGLCGAAAAWPLAARSQAARLRRIGYLHPQAASETGTGATALEIIQAELARLGHVADKTVAYELRFADGRPDRLPDLAADLVAREVDVIVAQTTTGAIAAKRLTSTIPIVFTSSGDAVGSGLVDSLARPGGNATGNSFLGTELAVKQLELLRELLPASGRIAFVGNATLQPEPVFFQQMQAPAQRLGFATVFVDIRSPEEFGRAVATLRAQQIEAAIWAPGGYTDSPANRARLLEAARDLSMPAMFFRREFVEAGGLISLGPSFPDLYRKAARYVDRILRGEKPADLPVQQPTQFELVFNARTAKALGIGVPTSILDRADQVIE